MHLHRKTIKQENVTTEATTTKNILDDLVDPFYLPLDEIVKHHVFETKHYVFLPVDHQIRQEISNKNFLIIDWELFQCFCVFNRFCDMGLDLKRSF